MTGANQSQSPSRLLLISVPKTASNLMLKMLNAPRQNVMTSETGGYYFYNAFITVTREGRLRKSISEWSEPDKQEIRDAFQEAVDALEACCQRAEQEGKMAFAKEHAFWFTNPAALGGQTEHAASFRPRIPDRYGPSHTFSPLNQTVLPDEYLRTWRLTFIIRHPALAFPSLYRAIGQFLKTGRWQTDETTGTLPTNMTLTWTRMLYDWCLEQPDLPGKPLVVDAEDVTHNPQVIVRYCEETGLDRDAVRFGWESKPAPPDWETLGRDSQNHHEPGSFSKLAESIMLSTLIESTGIIKDKTPTAVDVTAEVRQWKEEFGDEVAAILEKRVRDAMPDYEYLRSRRITV